MNFIIEPFYSIAKAAHHAGCSIDDIMELWENDKISIDLFINEGELNSGLIANVTFTDSEINHIDLYPDDDIELSYNVTSSSRFKINAIVRKEIYSYYDTITVQAFIYGLWRITRGTFNELPGMKRDDYKTIILTAHETDTGEAKASAELIDIFSDAKSYLLEESNLRINHFELMKLIHYSKSEHTPNKRDIVNEISQTNNYDAEEIHGNAIINSNRRIAVIHAAFQIVDLYHSELHDEKGELIDSVLIEKIKQHWKNIHGENYLIPEDRTLKDIISDIQKRSSDANKIYLKKKHDSRK